MAKTKKLIVTKSTRVADITALLPGDTLTKDGKAGVITEVSGIIKDGILHYTFILSGLMVYKEVFLFKLCKV